MASSYMMVPGQSAQELDYKRRLALALMQQGSDASPVQHWAQGLARMAQGALGGYELHAAEKADKEETARGNELLAKFLMGQGGATASANPAAPPRGNQVAAALAQPAGPVNPPLAAGDRPKVASSATVVGDDEGVRLGLYDPPQPGMTAPPVQSTQPMQGQNVNGGVAAPGFSPQPGLNREALIAMLGNRKTAPMAQQLISAQIGQQFKPSEYDYKPRDDGSIVAINKKNPRDTQIIQPGNSADLIKFAADKEAATTTAKLKAERAVTQPERERQQKQTADIVTQDIDRTLGKITTMPGRTTGVGGQVLSGIPGTEAHNVSKLLDTIKANAGFDQLNKMRQSSPTGGALGNVTERELALLQSTIGNLEQTQDEQQLGDNLRRVKNAWLDIIHGPGNGPPREKLTFQEQKPNVDALKKKYGLQ